MAKYKFEEEEDLGKVVESVKPFCTLSPNREISDIRQLTQGICGAKFSKLCGFTFRSKDGMSTKFLIVYCPKTRVNFRRDGKCLSGWYCWKWRDTQDVEVMPKTAMLQRFMFNVDKFFQSDIFEKMVPVFIRQTELALQTTVKKFLDQLQPSETDAQQARYMVSCTKASLDHMTDVTEEIDTGDSDEAVLAHNANAQYSLDLKDLKKKNEYSAFRQGGDKLHVKT